MRALLLLAAPPEPAVSGQRLRYRQHVEGLTRRGVEVGVVTFLRQAGDLVGLEALDLAHAVGVEGGNRTWPRTLASLIGGEPVHLRSYRSSRYEQLVAEAVAAFEPDVVIAGSCYLAPYLDVVPDRILRIVDEQNDEVEVWRIEEQSHPSRLRRLFARRNGAVLRAGEPRIVSSADATFAVSAGDRDQLLRRGRRSVHVVPNALDCARYAAPKGLVRDPHRLVFTGTDAARNVAALEWFFAEVWPRLSRRIPGVSMTVAGRFGPSWQRRWGALPGVEVPGPEESLLPRLHAASIFVNPFRLGGGSRLKVLEAGASGLALVSTPEGIRGFEPGDSVALVGDAESMAETLASLIAAPTRIRDLADRLERFVIAEHDVAVVGRKMVDTIQTLLGA